MADYENRIRDLERQTAASWQRIDHLDERHKALWEELRSMNAQSRDDYRHLQEAIQTNKEELSALITTNKLSVVAQTSTTKALAWGLSIIIAIGSAAAGISTAISRWFLN